MMPRMVAVGLFAWVTSLGAEAIGAPPRQEWLGHGHVDSPDKHINVRKMARTVLGWGEARYDHIPLLFGPLQARVFWRKAWTWNESALQTRLPLGLQGGPMLSIDLPLTPLGKTISLETRLCALRYVFAKSTPRRLISEELTDPQRKRQSFEAGLYLNIPLGGPR